MSGAEIIKVDAADKTKRLGGKYQGTWQTVQATWVIIVRKLTPTYIPKLPQTRY